MPKNTENPQTISPQQSQALALLVTGKAGRDVAHELKINESTISRWKREPEFIAAYNGALADAHQAIRDRLRALSVTALDVVADTLEDATIAPDVRLKAAFRILEMVASEPIGDDNAEALRDRQKEADFHHFLETGNVRTTHA